MPRKAKVQKEEEEDEEEIWSEPESEESDYEPKKTPKSGRKKSNVKEESSKSAAKVVADKNKAKSASTKQKTASSSSNVSSSAMAVNSEYMEDIKQIFNKFDTDNSGKIETNKLKLAMRALGFEPKSEEVKRISESYDKDGFIEYQDFIDLLVKRFTEKNVSEEIMKAFQLFDKDHTGKITIADLQRVSDELGEKISKDELKEMIEEADLDGDSAVDAQEFLRIMKKTSLY